MDGVFNINVGVLGHVDSGKTALVAGLSEVLSTAALDKNPQSRERGITLDLGFSAFQVPCPEDMKAAFGPGVHTLQFTLVDCPGHASLIRTVLVGAHILDVMILVVDCCKGIQAQTAECIVIGELLSSSMVVALNKVDLLPEEGRMKAMRRAGRGVRDALALTRFSNSEIVPVAAKIGGVEGASDGLQLLRDMLLRNLPPITRRLEQPFLFAVDHCFLIKGQGTVLTGTVLQGRAAVGDVVELPLLKQSKKIKSIQSFKRAVTAVQAGDRAGICVTQLAADRIERSLLSAPGVLPMASACVCAVERCRFHLGSIKSGQKVHIMIGNQAAMAQATFFGTPDGTGVSQGQALQDMFKHVGKHATTGEFDINKAYHWQEELFGIAGRPLQGGPLSANAPGALHFGQEWVLLELDRPVMALPGSVMLATKMDMSADASKPDCRVMFYGNLVHNFCGAGAHKQLRLYKTKWREGTIDRIDAKAGIVIIKGMFKKETTLSVFMGLPVVAASGEVGVLQQSFGKSGKVKAYFRQGVPSGDDKRVAVSFKRFVFDDTKKIAM